MLDTIFMIFGVIFVVLVILFLAGLGSGIIKVGSVEMHEEDEHTDVGGSNG